MLFTVAYQVPAINSAIYYQGTVIAIYTKYPTQLAKMSFDESLDLTADFFFIRSNIYMYVRTIIIYRDCCTGRPGGLLLVVSHVVVLVREFESRRGETFEFICENKRGSRVAKSA